MFPSNSSRSCRSISWSSERCRPPTPTARRLVPRVRSPRALSIPSPPSVEAEPPSPTTILRGGARAISIKASPSPIVCESSGSGSLSRANPEVLARSTTAVPSVRRAQDAFTVSPAGPRTLTTCRSLPGYTRRKSSVVPSPPSASGTQSTWSRGRDSSQPAARREAADCASTVPLKLSGQTRTLIATPPSWRGADRARRRAVNFHHHDAGVGAWPAPRAQLACCGALDIAVISQSAARRTRSAPDL